MGCGQVGADAGGAVPQQAGVAVCGVQQVVQQFAADPLFGLAGKAAGELEQGGDHRGAFEGALVDGGQVGVAVQQQGAQGFAARGDGGHPGVVLPYGVPVAAGAFDGGVPPGGGLPVALPAALRELDVPAQHFGQGPGHIGDAAAAQHQFGEPVVDVGGTADGLVDGAQPGQGLGGLGEQPGVVEGDGGVRGERTQQRDLFGPEDPLAPVGRVQHADDVAGAQQQRHAQDGDQPFLADSAVDGVGVPEAGVARIVLGGVGAGGLRHQPAQPLAHAEPQLLEAGGDGPFGDPHEGVAVLGVRQRHVGHVGAQQPAGPPHDGLEHLVQVAEPGQVVHRLEQCGQLRLAPPPRLQLGADAQRELSATRGGGRLPRTGSVSGRDRGVVRLGGGAVHQEFQIAEAGGFAVVARAGRGGVHGFSVSARSRRRRGGRPNR